MTQTTVTIAIFAAQSDAQAIRKAMESYPGCRSRLTQSRGLDGDTAAWIVIATLAGQALPHVLGAIKDYFAAKKVIRVKIDNWEVENPTPEIIERFLALTDAKANKSNESDKERPNP